MHDPWVPPLQARPAQGPTEDSLEGLYLSAVLKTAGDLDEAGESYWRQRGPGALATVALTRTMWFQGKMAGWMEKQISVEHYSIS